MIMNPPFTRAGSDWDGRKGQTYQAKQFHGLSIDRDTQSRMTELAKEYTEGTCAHGYAGIAASFVALADRMVKTSGTVALVLPMTALQGSTWQKVRQLIADSYRDLVLTIAASRELDRSFSADTSMAETVIVCRGSSSTAHPRGLFVSLSSRPDSEMEASEIARALRETSQRANVRTLEDGPFGGTPLYVGDERIGDMIEAPLSRNSPCSSVGIADFAVLQTAYQLARGVVW